VSRHVVFLDHILLFFISSTTHSLTRSDLIHIDYFSEDSDSLSFQVPSTPTLYYVWPICTDDSTSTNILLSGTPEASFSFMVLLTPSKIVDLPLRQNHTHSQVHKVTKYYLFLLFFIIYFLFSFHSLFL
jgi:hypothetical protein